MAGVDRGSYARWLGERPGLTREQIRLRAGLFWLNHSREVLYGIGGGVLGCVGAVVTLGFLLNSEEPRGLGVLSALLAVATVCGVGLGLRMARR